MQAHVPKEFFPDQEADFVPTTSVTQDVALELKQLCVVAFKHDCEPLDEDLPNASPASSSYALQTGSEQLTQGEAAFIEALDVRAGTAWSRRARG